MNLPPWVQNAIKEFNAPLTGMVDIKLELFKGGVTKIELGGIIRVKPDQKESENK
jgi:hypothetical protein